MRGNHITSAKHEEGQSKCQYKPPFDDTDYQSDDSNFNDCSCLPLVSDQRCHCTGVSNHWARESAAKRNHPPRQRGLIAYIRTTGSGLSAHQQQKIIDDYCRDNEYYIKKTFIDQGKPSIGLQAALAASEDADGLIASNLDRFVEHSNDRLRELRPFVHHFFCHPSKHLITVEEGVDTGSTIGQANVVNLMNHLKEARQFT